MRATGARGFTLVELMVAMVLGLVIVGGVISVMLANKRSYSSNEGLSQVQESARTAFELLARDVRQSAGNGCDNTTGTANALNLSTAWWREWVGLRGTDGGVADPAVAFGTAQGTRVAGTDSIRLQGLDGVALPIDVHNAGTGRIQINAATTPFVVGDIMIVCDFDHAAIFEVRSYDASTASVFHTAGGSSPGNCSQGLGFPTDCGSSTGNVYAFPRNSQIGRLSAVTWYVGNNARADEGGRSLYRVRLDAGGTEVVEEVVAGVTDLQVEYGITGSDTIASADSITTTDWARVHSIFITLTAESAGTNITTDAAVNNGRISRTFSYLITLRNRIP